MKQPTWTYGCKYFNEFDCMRDTCPLSHQRVKTISDNAFVDIYRLVCIKRKIKGE